jgi:hypothetical protein
MQEMAKIYNTGIYSGKLLLPVSTRMYLLNCGAVEAT